MSSNRALIAWQLLSSFRVCLWGGEMLMIFAPLQDLKKINI